MNSLLIPKPIPSIYPLKETSGCILHYDFQDLGSLIIDHSGMENHAGNSGSIALPVLNGYSRYFDGVDDHLTKSEQSVNNIIKSNFTASLWVNCLNEAEENPSLMYKDAYLDCNINSFTINYEDSAFMTSVIERNRWYHLVYRLDISKVGTADNMNIFVDGKLDSFDETSINTITGTNDLLLVGAGSAFFKGNIGDMKVFNRALADTEITELFKNEAWGYGLSIY